MADLDPKATPSLMPSADPDAITGAEGVRRRQFPG